MWRPEYLAWDGAEYLGELLNFCAWSLWTASSAAPTNSGELGACGERVSRVCGHEMGGETELAGFKSNCDRGEASVSVYGGGGCRAVGGNDRPARLGEYFAFSVQSLARPYTHGRLRREAEKKAEPSPSWT